MLRVMRRIPLYVLALSMLGACPKPPPPAVSPPPVDPPADPEPPVEEEPETEPVVQQEPRFLDIQRNVIRLKPGTRILFKTNSAEIDETSNEILDEVASVMDQNQRIRIRVEGHTDNTGQAAYNKKLSDERSASVRAYLTGKGVAEDRLESHGCGPDHPLADNATEEGKQMNRRVEFVILRKRRKAEPCQKYQPRERRRDRGGDAPAPDGAPGPS